MAPKPTTSGKLQQSVNMKYAYSAKVIINKQRVKTDGTVTIYIQLIYDRQRKNINLQFDWPADKVDLEEGKLLPRQRNDKACDDNNIIIRNELSKLNEVFRMARMANLKLSLEQVLKEYENFANKEDFLIFAFHKIEEREKTGLIRSSTAKTHRNAFHSFKKFKKTIPFSEINKDLMESYKAFMFRTLNYDSDTAQTKLKNIRTYMNHAKTDGFIFDYPFGKFKMPTTEARIEFVEEKEFEVLKRYFWAKNLTPGTNKEKALRGFLFICYTGVRLGDLYALTHKNIKRNALVFIPQKSDSDHQHEVVIPLHAEALKLIETKSGNLFILPPESKIREALHYISNKLGLESKVGPHIGRHTFATRFLAAGGRLEVLQKLLGHASIKTTMIYVHVTEERKREEINFLK